MTYPPDVHDQDFVINRIYHPVISSSDSEEVGMSFKLFAAMRPRLFTQIANGREDRRYYRPGQLLDFFSG